MHWFCLVFTEQSQMTWTEGVGFTSWTTELVNMTKDLKNRLLCIVYVPTFTKLNKNMIRILVMNFSCFMNCYVKNVKFLNDKSLWCVQIVKKLFRIKTYFWIVGSFFLWFLNWNNDSDCKFYRNIFMLK